jgi:tetratricopeptide (TPR) repeat protein
MVEDFPLIADYRRDLARGIDELGKFHQASGVSVRAQQLHAEAGVLYQDLVRDFPKNPQYRRDRSRNLEEQGKILVRLNQENDALILMRKAGAYYRELITEFEDNVDVRVDLSRNLEETGRLLIRLQRMPEAITSFEEANDELRRLVEQFPSTTDYLHDLARSCAEWAAALGLANRPEEADRTYREADQIYRRLIREHPSQPQAKVDLAYMLGNWSGILPPDAATDRLQEAVAMWSAILKEKPRDASIAKALNWTEQKLGNLIAANRNQPASNLSSRARSSGEDILPQPGKTSGLENAARGTNISEIAALDTYTLLNQVGQRAIVRGIPVSVLTDVGKERLTFIRFGTIKHQFCAIIHRSAMPNFESIFGLGLGDIVGKDIHLDGVIGVFKNTPQVVLNRTEQIRILPANPVPTSAPSSDAAILPENSSDDVDSLIALAGKQVRVIGKISSLHPTASGVFTLIHFGPPRKKKFTAVIRNENLPVISVAHGGSLEKSLVGQTVRITGHIYIHKGMPSLEITSPHQIEVLPTPAVIEE